MDNLQKVASCTPYSTQLATFEGVNATISATNTQHDALKAAADKVLLRNHQRNQRATIPKKQRNFHPVLDPQKLHGVAPVFDDPAHAKLQQIAQELDWPLDDLLDWYSDPMDMNDLARLSMDRVRQVVQDYITNHDLCRSDYRSLAEVKP